MSGRPDNFMEEGGQNTASITRIKLCPKPINNAFWVNWGPLDFRAKSAGLSLRVL